MTTEQKIYKWILDNFGETEANDPSYNIRALAKYLDNN